MFSLRGIGFAWGKRAKIATALIGTALYFGAVSWAKISYHPDTNFTAGPNVAGEKILLLKPFTRTNGFGFASERPTLFESVVDTDEEPHRSPVALFENTTRLGPAHSSNGDIGAFGHGRFAHRRTNGATVFFSASDNTDPNTNGRAYWIVKPPHPVASTQD
ncbi:MAG: hypothetical protein HY852_05430 [Bradyrhizobium sp.]|uniref:hypothetical protein n=1 Tax=Bradyrhizobium sp. TaxID=376 RepID=UPI0025B9035B|nr:hypothetical protein [Bradyrhizobium sp.]MBI5261244.1 hypothetical protein [Bradyrhizobium sp.]